MAAERLTPGQIGLPDHVVGDVGMAGAFDLSSHARAREALSFGLDTGGTEHNVYVLGPDRSGRMTATREFIATLLAGRPAADDWVYLFDFDAPSHPRPVRLPEGLGKRLHEAVADVIPALARQLAVAFSSDVYQRQLEHLRERGEAEVQSRLRALDADARRSGLALLSTPQGALIASLGEDGEPVPVQLLSAEKRDEVEQRSRPILEQMAAINRDAARLQRDLFQSIKRLNGEVAQRATEGLMGGLIEDVGQEPTIKPWLERMGRDVVERYELFLGTEGNVVVPRPEAPRRRYGVNLLVDRSGDQHPPLICEHNPTYASLFGTIEYRQVAGGALDTDVSLIRAGALHRATGGVLVLRADALVMQPMLWGYLKAAMRDREIRIEEPYRINAPPIAGAPKPLPIPLEVKVVVIGAPQWYYGFFALDPEFQLYFKVKAEIEPTVDATAENLAAYAGLIRSQGDKHAAELDGSAMTRLLGISSRWAGHRDKLTAAYELVADVLIEASKIAPPGTTLDRSDIDAAVQARRRRNSQIEDRVHKAIEEGITLIQTRGRVVGQINGLTVQFVGDHTFGAPARITARSSIGRRGIVSIERLVAMSGPIQQKARLVLQGILMRRFAHRIPLSFDCSVTFEQLYGAVEGDSASMAEYIAIISELADMPVRQEIAITGSINQLGEAQVIGGVHHKVEGFYRACRDGGGLTGEQGVIVPIQNRNHLVVRDEIRDAVAAGEFHLWTVRSVEEAMELLLEAPSGEVDAAGDYPPDSIYGRVMRTLEGFDASLRDRGI
jgi:predicted ATP-dependent protease